ncbi:hypothetical protein A0J61_03121 [Choanephora cucurbitarum]|uniref:Uncharacterized protein n=1 Tax=Choanephora cucurbitarum TaxID=101091 RepID=A0A1C7NJ66_9FUNG|nr:hypothetical protein A0J61_03121 [Choanephora cucurbitarum]
MISAWTTKGTGIFFLLALISLAATWTYMFQFFFYSYRQWKATASYGLPVSLDSISLWLHDTSLFDSAWRQVSVGDWQWLWSHQLCSLTVSVWTPILAIEGHRRQIPFIWAYMLLGQVVAISFASSLAFAVILAYPASKEPSDDLLKRIVLCIVGGLGTVVLSPFVAKGEGFMLNLLTMHILLILPLFQTKTSSTKQPMVIMMIYVFASGANLMIYLQQWYQCLSSLSSFWPSTILEQLITVFFHHPAQSSISSDIVCMQLITMTWIWIHRRTPYALPLLVMTPLLSASVTLPLFFSLMEYQKQHKLKQ